jgi:hypothetical protein
VARLRQIAQHGLGARQVVSEHRSGSDGKPRRSAAAAGRASRTVPAIDD